MSSRHDYTGKIVYVGIGMWKLRKFCNRKFVSFTINLFAAIAVIHKLLIIRMTLVFINIFISRLLIN